jgi:uncharacterized protein (TIGR02118 family)
LQLTERRAIGSRFALAFIESPLSADRNRCWADNPAYVAMGHLLFDSTEAFQQSFGPHSTAIVGDIPNYTNTQPTIQSAK